MKKYSLIFLLLIFLFSCEDESVDITVMPEATTEGADTFGCLVDGWIYVGGRYFDMELKYRWTQPSIEFKYHEGENILFVHVILKPQISISFEIPEPEEGVCLMKNVSWNNESMDDCVVIISRFDKEARIISGEFDGGRITFGRFDVNYSLRP